MLKKQKIKTIKNRSFVKLEMKKLEKISGGPALGGSQGGG